MTPTARDRQIAEALIEERIRAITPTAREMQVARHLGALERIREEGLPGLPGGPPLASYDEVHTFPLAAERDPTADTAFITKMIEHGLAGDLPDPQPWARDLYEAAEPVHFLKNRSGASGDAVFTWGGSQVRVDGSQLLVNASEITVDWKVSVPDRRGAGDQLDAYRYMFGQRAGFGAFGDKPLTLVTDLGA